MNILLTNKRLLILILISILLAGTCVSCNGGDATSPDYITVLTTSATEDLSPYFTEAAQTVFAQITETALAQPSQTPVPPTETPVPTNTATSTTAPSSTTYYVYVAPVVYTNTPATITPAITLTKASYGCSITSQSVSDGTEFAPNEDFDASWTIKNTGSEKWEASEIDYRYVSGTAMHKFNAVYDFPSSVAEGESITITVDMTAPSSAANYETFWAISRSSGNFCTLPIRIKVK